ncbi:PDZ/DHR/GLGF domain protein [Paragonimus skrjabini miyazakii]|uniref:PDZ/DHR/GLGF domain protein n=1 Tax=Paragonimus skrjabini miyazakii TaxID=59628 RepID=A0A8S9YXY2_9TREM|nr:PDZ/DHR/GLGF domain protein [Paragonimus skrjabini miyazakii]
MSRYPKLDETVPSVSKNLSQKETDSSGSDSDSDDSELGQLDDIFYDEYGNVVCKPNPKTPNSTSQVSSTSSGVLATGVGSTQSDIHKRTKHPAVKQVVLHKDASGKLGIKLRRMGNAMYFAFVDVNSPVANVGIGFADQLVQVRGVNISDMTGSQMMHWISANHAKEIHATVAQRPYDFDIDGTVNSQGELAYRTKQGKELGSVKLQKVLQKGHLKHLQIIAVNGKTMLGCIEQDFLSAFQNATGTIQLRVIPRILTNHLLKRQNKAELRNRMQLSKVP